MHEYFATLNTNQQETNRQLALANTNNAALNLRYEAMDRRLGDMDTNYKEMDRRLRCFRGILINVVWRLVVMMMMLRRSRVRQVFYLCLFSLASLLFFTLQVGYCVSGGSGCM